MRNVCGAYRSLFQHLLTTDAQSFQNFMRMDFVAFGDVLSRVEDRLIKKDTKMRRSISPRERLCLVIRYLATAMQYCNRPNKYYLQ